MTFLSGLLLGLAFGIAAAFGVKEAELRRLRRVHEEHSLQPAAVLDHPFALNADPFRYHAATTVAVILVLAGGFFTAFHIETPPGYTAALGLGLAWLFVVPADLHKVH